MQFDILLLDADGTLFDFHAAQRQALERAFSRYALPFSEETLLLYDALNEGLWRKLERGEITREELFDSRFRLLFEELGRSVDTVRFNADYLDALAGGVFLLPGALELCRRLHERCRLYLATNAVEHVQKRRLRASELAPYIDNIFTSEEMGYEKPDPRYFDGLFRRLGNPDRRRVLMLGDSLTSDMLGAVRAGIACCWYCPDAGKTPGGIPIDYRIERLEDFIPIVLESGMGKR
ncbi:MAG: noncanonical pyrimidine nucleotidase, YjjG family [Provencibacterium sp.]|jgi:2-haloacid dehalogenase|nr:noncanonical pyrimidine nucleotidase, YjjG family [Provencibacterium sp.]